MSPPVQSIATHIVTARQPRTLKAERLRDAAGIREAQALRYRIFSGELAAQLKGGEFGLDMDEFDPYCLHIGVRDLNSGALAATTRLLDQRAAARIGRFYSQSEFNLIGLEQLQGPILEVGRTCVDAAYRNGATITVLWSELAEILNEGNYRYLMGCASVPMDDGGVQAAVIMQRLRLQHMSTGLLRAEPKTRLPELQLPDNLSAEMPPLLKAYMRLGARICGEPCWDQDFQVADLFILLRREDLCPRYARHFKAAV
jgi:putative hemolysin